MSLKQQKSDPLGLIHVISGNGKGKTTSALGMAIRAAGHNYKVLFIQFMKKGWPYGELEVITNYLSDKITIEQFGTPEFVDKNNPKEIDLLEARKGMDRAWKAIREKWDVVILDEIHVTIEWNLIAEDELLKLIKEKPSNLELILTGRYARQSVIDASDYYSEVKEVKHPYMQDILARKGVEF